MRNAYFLSRSSDWPAGGFGSGGYASNSDCPTDRASGWEGAGAEPRGFPLAMADEGAKVRIVALLGGKSLAMRLTELGLNVGTELQLIQRQGGGLVVARGESRIALGGGMAAKILVAPLA